MHITIELPDIKAVSRNETTGHFYNYKTVLNKAELWMVTFGKHYEHHFEKPVDVFITAYYRTGYDRLTQGTNRCADTPNIDDKIFTDILIRKKPMKGGARERSVWFLEDDNPKYLRYVIKRAVPAPRYKVVITIVEIDDPEYQLLTVPVMDALGELQYANTKNI